MAVRGVRGATTVKSNIREEIVEKTSELLELIVEKNDIDLQDIASVILSVTDDINAEFPAVAARDLGWIYTPLLCTREIPIKGSLKNCIRVLMHVNSDKDQESMIHVYLHNANQLRPDLDTNKRDKYYTSGK
ncbi:MAG: chorismate mutase [Spirochaetota bacterium]|nr:chorismate mutase [Spirochaetota bacterium]